MSQLVGEEAGMTFDYEELRIARGWPTPMFMHKAADGLDAIAVTRRYGDVLRWVADQCDLSVMARRTQTGEPPRFTDDRKAVTALAEVAVKVRQGKASPADLYRLAAAVAASIPVRACDACGTEYVFNDRRKARFCSSRCRFRVAQRARRLRLSEADR